jgi:hypothetical protein
MGGVVVPGFDRVLGPRFDMRVRNSGGRLMVTADGTSLELSESAGFVFRQVDGIRTVREIGALLAAEYNIDVDEATADAAEVLAKLLAHTMLLPEPM